MPPELRRRSLNPRHPFRSNHLRFLTAFLFSTILMFVAPETAGARAGDVPAPEACIDCHLEMTVMSHPVGIAPPPAGLALPLAPDGTITCGTCHGSGPHRASSTELRNPADACQICHERGGHAEAPMLAHLVRMDPNGGAHLVEVTKTCIGCHDGSSTQRTHVRHQPEPRPRGEIGSGADLQRGHPVGMEYTTSRTLRPRGYRPTSDLPPQIMFESGRVGCASCHDLFSDHRAHLVVDNRGSVLCLSCHAKTPNPPLVPVEPRMAMLNLER